MSKTFIDGREIDLDTLVLTTKGESALRHSSQNGLLHDENLHRLNYRHGEIRKYHTQKHNIPGHRLVDTIITGGESEFHKRAIDWFYERFKDKFPYDNFEKRKIVKKHNKDSSNELDIAFTLNDRKYRIELQYSPEKDFESKFFGQKDTYTMYILVQGKYFNHNHPHTQTELDLMMLNNRVYYLIDQFDDYKIISVHREEKSTNNLIMASLDGYEEYPSLQFMPSKVKFQKRTYSLATFNDNNFWLQTPKITDRPPHYQRKLPLGN